MYECYDYLKTLGEIKYKTNFLGHYIITLEIREPITISEWNKLLDSWNDTWRKIEKSGKKFCLHKWGDPIEPPHDIPPTTISAVVVYPNGTKRREIESKGSYIVKCVKCGKIKVKSLDAPP
ncbi:hypothetical protein DRO97_02445 [Archaeoglobales archaeon]|nr:MAG: hypothetical protein DRO97_02445 [Archaeoglobales archaeon]